MPPTLSVSEKRSCCSALLTCFETWTRLQWLWSRNPTRQWPCYRLLTGVDCCLRCVSVLAAVAMSSTCPGLYCGRMMVNGSVEGDCGVSIKHQCADCWSGQWVYVWSLCWQLVLAFLCLSYDKKCSTVSLLGFGDAERRLYNGVKRNKQHESPDRFH